MERNAEGDETMNLGDDQSDEDDSIYSHGTDTIREDQVDVNVEGNSILQSATIRSGIRSSEVRRLQEEAANFSQIL